MPKKLLTVDDSKTIRMIVTRAFKAYDVEVLEAANGVEGLAAAAREKPDIIILDVTMPVMDGYETLARLKESPELKAIPVIMLTAEAGRENVLRIAKLGVRDYLVKPFKEDLVVERVSRVIELRPKAIAPARKVFTDPLKILVVEDKPAVQDQIRAALSRTPWRVEGQAQPKTAIDVFNHQSPDAALISLSLPEGAAFVLFEAIRSAAQVRKVPILGLSVKTASAEQERARAAGFTDIIFKPIDAQEVQAKLVTALHLDTSGQYFAQRDGVLVIKLPPGFSAGTAQEVERYLKGEVTKSVEAGSDKVAVDLSEVQQVDAAVVKLCGRVVKLCQDLGLRHVLIGSERRINDCVDYADTQGWRFAPNWAGALAAFDKQALAA